jgi:hypothetical protein
MLLKQQARKGFVVFGGDECHKDAKTQRKT